MNRSKKYYADRHEAQTASVLGTELVRNSGSSSLTHLKGDSACKLVHVENKWTSGVSRKVGGPEVIKLSLEAYSLDKEPVLAVRLESLECLDKSWCVVTEEFLGKLLSVYRSTQDVLDGNKGE